MLIGGPAWEERCCCLGSFRGLRFALGDMSLAQESTEVFCDFILYRCIFFTTGLGVSVGRDSTDSLMGISGGGSILISDCTASSRIETTSIATGAIGFKLPSL